jgi:hypothetical protein
MAQPQNWETPRNVALIIAAIAAIATAFGAVAGYVGFKIGQQTPPIVIQMQQPPPR